MAAIKLGSLLLKAKVLTESQLNAALAEQSKWGGKLGEILVRMNILTEEMLVKALSKQLNIAAVSLESIQGIAPHVRAKVPLDVARDLSALPLQLRDDGRTLVVAMAEPQNLDHVDTLRSVSRCKIIVQIAGRTSIARAFGRFYEGEADLSDNEGSFKFVDSQGNTMVKDVKDIKRPTTSPPAPNPNRSAPKPPPNMPPPPPPVTTTPQRMSLSEVPVQTPASGSPVEMLKQIEDAQRKEVVVLKSLVELLIEKGVFTRDEYLAKVRK